MNRVRVAGGVALVFLVASGFYFFALGGGTSTGSIKDVSVDVVLNDEMSEEAFEGESGSCLGAGPPPDHFVVTLEGVVNDEYSGRYVSDETYELVTRIGNGTDRRNKTVVDGGSERVNSMVMIPDDESVDSGQEATVTVSLEHNGDTVDSVERTVTVKEGNLNLDCDGGQPVP
jgi:hypothetical protein